MQSKHIKHMHVYLSHAMRARVSITGQKLDFTSKKAAENRARIAPAHFSFMKVGIGREGGIRKREEGEYGPINKTWSFLQVLVDWPSTRAAMSQRIRGRGFKSPNKGAAPDHCIALQKVAVTIIFKPYCASLSPPSPLFSLAAFPRLT